MKGSACAKHSFWYAKVRNQIKNHNTMRKLIFVLALAALSFVACKSGSNNAPVANGNATEQVAPAAKDGGDAVACDTVCKKVACACPEGAKCKEGCTKEACTCCCKKECKQACDEASAQPCPQGKTCKKEACCKDNACDASKCKCTADKNCGKKCCPAVKK